ncbi:hypothetical protein OXX69_010219 [Metschnikowia pulcherrima]
MDHSDYRRGYIGTSMLGSIAGKIASTSHRVRSKTGRINSRVHEHWRKPAHMPTKTVDEDFEELMEELEAISNSCHDIISVNAQYMSLSTEVIESARRVANSVQVLSSPGRLESTTVNPNNERAGLCERTRSYAAAMVEIRICLKESLRSIPQNIDERVKALQNHIDKVQDRVALRDKALLSFDRVYDKFDGMTILSTTSEFTAKQKQEYHSLEKKLVELRRIYEDHNTALKRELPSFFMLVRTFIEPLMQFLFFVQLTAAYQVQSNLLTVSQDLDENASVTPLPSFRINTSRSSLRGQHDNMSVVLHENGSHSRSERSGKRRKAPTMTSKQEAKRPSTARSDESESDNVFGQCRALFNFTSNIDTDLEFEEGDVIKILSCDGDWWAGSLRDKHGFFPGAYVERI